MKNLSKALKILLLSTLVSSQVAANNEKYDAPGDVYLMFQQFRMYIDCQGEGDIPIIIEPGIGDSLANWIPVQTALAKHTTVCLYDRAGMGLSDPGPGPRTTSQIATELYNLLLKANIDGPYIFVGHSFGGYVAQYMAQVAPQLTAGVVLVDSSHPDQVERLAVLDNKDVMPKQTIGGYRFEDESKLTFEQRYWKHLNAQRKSVWSQMDELSSFEDSAEEVKETRTDSLDIPVAVLTRGKKQLPDIPGHGSLEAVWQDMQQDLTTLSDNSWQVIVEESGHSIHQEAPQVIVDNTLLVLQRAKQTLAQKETL